MTMDEQTSLSLCMAALFEYEEPDGGQRMTETGSLLSAKREAACLRPNGVHQQRHLSPDSATRCVLLIVTFVPESSRSSAVRVDVYKPCPVTLSEQPISSLSEDKVSLISI